MKFIDTSQNLRARLFAVQMIAVLLLGLLGVRLYLLQVVRGSYYGEIAQNQRIRLLPIPAPRGIIFDRNGLPLVDSRPIYTVILSREDARKDLGELVKPLAEGLNVDPDLLRERFEEIKSLPSFESVPIKQDATPGDIAWIEARELEFPELRIEQQPQRRYPADGSLAHVVGYVGEIGPE
jgi:penicillin-binding protein 2